MRQGGRSCGNVVIYDLGGGTFDASLVKMTGRWNEVVTSEGIQRLGGDDFDEVILKLVLTESKLLHELDPTTRDLLLEECTARKEAVGPNTRRFLVDLSAVDRPPLSRPIEDVYAACAPLVDKTVEVLTSVLRDPARHGGHVEWSEIAGIYTVGGAAGFPLVGRMLRKSFGEKRMKRSPHPFAATACRPRGIPRQGGRLRALRPLFAAFRGLSRGAQWRRRRIRPHPSEGPFPAPVASPRSW